MKRQSSAKITVLQILLQILYTLLFADIVFSKDVRELGLKEIIEIGKHNDLELEKLEYEKLRRDLELSKNIFKFIPKLEYYLDRTRLFTTPRGSTVYTLGGQVSLPLYDRQLIYERRKLKKDKLRTYKLITKRLNDLIYELADLYYYIRYTEEVIKITTEDYLSAKASFELNEKKYEENRIIEIDLLLAKGLMLEVESQLHAMKHRQMEALLKLKNKLRLDGQIKLKQNDKAIFNLTNVEPLPYYRSNNRNLELEIYELDKLISKDLYEIERSIYYPKLSLHFDITNSSTDELSYYRNFDWSLYAIATFYILDELSLELRGGLKDTQKTSQLGEFQRATIKLNPGGTEAIKRLKSKQDYLTTISKLKEYKLLLEEEIVRLHNKVKESINEEKRASLYTRIGDGLVNKLDFEYKIGKTGYEQLIDAQRRRAIYRREKALSSLNKKKLILTLKKSLGLLSWIYLEKTKKDKTKKAK